MNRITKILLNPLVIITFAALIIYFKTFFFGLVFLDDFDIVGDPLSKVSNLNSFKDVLVSKYLGGHYYRPFTLLSFYTTAKSIGEAFWIYHVTNFLIHNLTAIILFKILKKLNYSNGISLFSSLLFTAHPLFVNAVVWIAGRNDLLIALFCLLSFWFLLKYNLDKKWANLILYTVFLSLSFLSKEAAMPFPLLCIGYFIITNIKDKSYKSIVIFLISIFSILLYFLLRFFISSTVSVDKFSFDALLLNIRIIPETISKIFLPVNLKVLPDFNLWVTLSGIFILILLLILPFYIKTINKLTYWFGILWFLLLMIPGLLVRTMVNDNGFQYWDCRAYLPAAGLFLSITEVFSKIKFKFSSKFKLVVATVSLLILTGLNLFHSEVYKNPVTFWQSAINDYPKRALFYAGLSAYYEFDKQYDKASKNMETASILYPERLEYYTRTADLYLKEKQLERALKIINRGLNHFREEEKLKIYLVGIKLLLNDSSSVFLLQKTDAKNKEQFSLEVKNIFLKYFGKEDSKEFRDFLEERNIGSILRI